MVGLNDRVLALDFDLAAAAKLLGAERAAANAAAEGIDEAGGIRRSKNVHW